jgi:hypothetical protein
LSIDSGEVLFAAGQRKVSVSDPTVVNNPDPA